MNTVYVEDWGLADYHDACQWQRQRVEEVIAGGPQRLILCEHPPVLTQGRLSRKENILFSPQQLTSLGVEVVPVDRGGDVTLHCPGQLVVYPILNLGNYHRDLRGYLHRLEQAAIDLLDNFGILANRFLGRTGVWAADRKIVSIGIGVRKWVSFHGLGMNVNTDLKLFQWINPCGLDVAMTSMAAIKGHTVAMEDVKRRVVEVFMKEFELERAQDPGRVIYASADSSRIRGRD